MKIKENEASPLIHSCAQISHHWTESKRQDPLARHLQKDFFLLSEICFSMKTTILPLLISIKIKNLGADRMGQWVEAPTSDPDDLSSTPRTHMVEERTNSHRFSPDLHMCVYPQTK